MFIMHFKGPDWTQTWNLSKILHRRIFRPKILHRQFHPISTVLVIKTQKNEWKWRNLHRWQKFYTAAGTDGTDKFHLWPFVESNLDNKEIMRGIVFILFLIRWKKASVGDWHGLANLNGSFIPDENGGRLLQPSPLMQWWYCCCPIQIQIIQSQR